SVHGLSGSQTTSIGCFVRRSASSTPRRGMRTSRPSSAGYADADPAGIQNTDRSGRSSTTSAATARQTEPNQTSRSATTSPLDHIPPVPERARGPARRNARGEQARVVRDDDPGDGHPGPALHDLAADDRLSRPPHRLESTGVRSAGMERADTLAAAERAPEDAPRPHVSVVVTLFNEVETVDELV